MSLGPNQGNEENIVYVPGALCPNCHHRGEIWCRYWDSGGDETFADNYQHECGDCDHVESIDTGHFTYDGPSVPCPLCGRNPFSGVPVSVRIKTS